MPKRSIVVEPNQQSIVATTVFNAPRDLVFKLMTDPELIPQWWGPRVMDTVVDKMEPWPGGSWRFVVSPMGGKPGKVYSFHGVYHTIQQNETTVNTHEYEDEPGQVSLETNIFEDFEGGTKLTVISLFQSVANRDAMAQSDFQDGEQESLNRLEELLDSVQSAAAV